MVRKSDLGSLCLDGTKNLELANRPDNDYCKVKAFNETDPFDYDAARSWFRNLAKMKKYFEKLGMQASRVAWASNPPLLENLFIFVRVLRTNV